MTDLVERYNGIEQDPEGLYVLFEDFEHLQAENKRLERDWKAAMINVGITYNRILEFHMRQELFERAIEDYAIVMAYPDIREFLGSEICQIVDRSVAALGDTKAQVTLESTAPAQPGGPDKLPTTDHSGQCSTGFRVPKWTGWKVTR